MWKGARFYKTCVLYLGHRLDAEGIHPTTDKLIALQNAQEPLLMQELRSYLGMNLSTVLVPLHKLLQKDTSWHWGSEQENAFVESNVLLQSSQVFVRYYPVI